MTRHARRVQGSFGPEGVACVVKHFPSGGPQKDGEDAHFPYGRELVYPAGQFEDHLAPFRPAVALGVAGVMRYYGACRPPARRRRRARGRLRLQERHPAGPAARRAGV